MKIYIYKNCSSCQKTMKILKDKPIDIEILPIREQPPTIAELKYMLKHIENINKLINTSSKDYRENKEKIKKMSDEELLIFLSKNGNFIKRPFVLMKNDAWVGHKEEKLKTI